MGELGNYLLSTVGCSLDVLNETHELRRVRRTSLRGHEHDANAVMWDDSAEQVACACVDENRREIFRLPIWEPVRLERPAW